METFWLEGRKDMATANDTMVCLWRPKKKPKVKKKDLMSEITSISAFSEHETSLRKSNASLNKAEQNLSDLSVGVENESRDTINSMNGFERTKINEKLTVSTMQANATDLKPIGSETLLSGSNNIKPLDKDDHDLRKTVSKVVDKLVNDIVILDQIANEFNEMQSCKMNSPNVISDQLALEISQDKERIYSE